MAVPNRPKSLFASKMNCDGDWGHFAYVAEPTLSVCALRGAPRQRGACRRHDQRTHTRATQRCQRTPVPGIGVGLHHFTPWRWLVYVLFVRPPSSLVCKACLPLFRRGAPRRSDGLAGVAGAARGGSGFLSRSVPAASSVSGGVDPVCHHLGGLVTKREVRPCVSTLESCLQPTAVRIEKEGVRNLQCFCVLRSVPSGISYRVFDLVDTVDLRADGRNQLVPRRSRR